MFHFIGKKRSMCNNDKQFYLLATGGNDSLVKLWRLTIFKENEITTGGNGSSDNDFQYREEKSLAGHGGNVTCVRFSSLQNQVLGSVATDRTARIWSVVSFLLLQKKFRKNSTYSFGNTYRYSIYDFSIPELVSMYWNNTKVS